jgi:type IV secretory pathway VirB6-like protein
MQILMLDQVILKIKLERKSLKKNNSFNLKLLMNFTSLIIILLLSGCGMVSCMGEGNGGNCKIGAEVNPNIYSIPMDPLPSVNSSEGQQFTMQTVWINSANKDWTNTGITFKGNEQVTIKIVPNSIKPSTNLYPSIANGTINTCYVADEWDLSEGGALWFYRTDQIVQPKVYYYPGAVQILALLDPSYTSNNPPNITSYNGPKQNYCSDDKFAFCPNPPFDTSCTLGCSAKNGQGLSTEFIDDSGNSSYAGCSGNFLGSSNCSEANVFPLYSYAQGSNPNLFSGGASILTMPNPTNALCADITVPYEKFPAFPLSILSGIFDTCGINPKDPNPNNAQNCAVINTNYKLRHVTTGCYGVNGVMETVPSGNSDIGKLQYVVSNSTPQISSGNSNFPAKVGEFIEKNDTDENGIISTTFNASAGTLYMQVYDCVGTNNINVTDQCIPSQGKQLNYGPSCYEDNVGQYEVQIITPIPQSESYFGWLTTDIVTAIANQNEALSQTMFSSIISNTQFKNIVNAFLILYVIIYGISFASGIIMVTQKDAVIRILKIGAVLAVIGEDSSIFFSQLYNAFINGLPYLASIAGGGNGSVGDLFQFADVTIAYLTNAGVWWRIIMFMFLWPIGWFLQMIAGIAVINYSIVIVEAFLSYLVAITGIALFIALAPLFIILALFNHTRPIFENWVKILVGFVLQPIVLFSCIAIVNELVLTALNNLLQNVQYRCLVPIFFDLPPFKINIVCFAAFIPNPFDILNLIVLTLILFIFVDVLKKMPDFVKELARYLGSPGSGVIGETAAKIRSGAVESSKGMVGMNKESVDRRKFIRDRTLKSVTVSSATPADSKKDVTPSDKATKA